MTQNTRHLLYLLALVMFMFGLAFAFVPLYRMFCQALGIPVPSVMVGEAGAPKTITEVSDRVITVRFMANNEINMPVKLKPMVRKLRVRLGEPAITAYKANNPSNRNIDGVAVHTIVALGGNSVNVDSYIDLQQCFCFEEQHYAAGADVNLPLSFTVTPDLPEGVHTITFGYTLFEAEDMEEKS